MSFLELKNAILTGVFLSFMIGPVFFMLIQTSILRGAKVALAFNTGVILGDIAFILISYFGSRPVLNKIKDDPRLFILGGIIILVYGIITVLQKKKENETLEESTITIPKKNNYYKLIFHGFFLNCINVGVLAFWLGLIVVVIPTLNMTSIQIFWYFAAIIGGYFTTDIIKIILAKQLKSFLTPKNIQIIKKIMGFILVAFGIVMILKGFIPKEQLNLEDFLNH
ncbi:LysE family translocator [Wenyingzhuangia sp. IMCC45574]